MVALGGVAVSYERGTPVVRRFSGAEFSMKSHKGSLGDDRAACLTLMYVKTPKWFSMLGCVLAQAHSYFTDDAKVIVQST